MKKIVLLFTVFALLQVSCSKNEDNDVYDKDQVFQESQLIGFWKHDASKQNASDKWNTELQWPFDFFELKSTQSFSLYTLHSNYEASPVDIPGKVGKWEFDGKNLLTYTLDEGSSYQLKLIKVSDKELIAEIDGNLKNGSQVNEIRKYTKTIISSPDDYYAKFTQGLKIKDYTNFMPISAGNVRNAANVPQNPANELSYLIGIKNHKLWVGLFDDKREQLSERIDQEDFSLMREVHLGYGKYETLFINQIQVVRLTDDIFILTYTMNNENVAKHTEAVLWFTASGKKIDYSQNILSVRDTRIEPWYNNSYIIGLSTFYRHWVCYSHQGDTILSGEEEWRREDIVYPVSYNYYIDVDPMVYDKKITFKTRRLIDDGNPSWTSNSIVLQTEEKDFKYTITVLKKETTAWTFQVDITEYSGKKHSETVVVDITGMTSE